MKFSDNIRRGTFTLIITAILSCGFLTYPNYMNHQEEALTEPCSTEIKELLASVNTLQASVDELEISIDKLEDRVEEAEGQ